MLTWLFMISENYIDIVYSIHNCLVGIKIYIMYVENVKGK